MKNARNIITRLLAHGRPLPLLRSRVRRCGQQRDGGGGGGLRVRQLRRGAGQLRSRRARDAPQHGTQRRRQRAAQPEAGQGGPAAAHARQSGGQSRGRRLGERRSAPPGLVLRRPRRERRHPDGTC